MSGCHSAAEYVYQYLDEELTYTHKVKVRWHLKRCGNCVSAFQFERDLRAMIAVGGKTEPPEELFVTLRSLIQQERNESDSGC